MEDRIDTTIQFSGLKSGVYNYDYTLDDSFFSSYKNEKILGGRVVFEVKMEKNDRLMMFFFKYTGTVKTTCDRCLEDLQWPVQGEQTLCVKLSDDESSDDENVAILPESAFKIDLAQWMYEYVAVAMPIQCLHPDDADGRPTCNPEMMEYLNAAGDEQDGEHDSDPRWEALKQLR